MAVVVAQVIRDFAPLVIGLAIGFGACAVIVDKERAQHRAAILQIESTAQAAALAAADTARDEQAAITSQYDKAINDALENQSALRADAVRARSQLASLRSQTQAAASRIAMPDTAPATIAEYATTAGELLASCTEEYQELAEKADQHAASVKLMQEAWPTLR